MRVNVSSARRAKPIQNSLFREHNLAHLSASQLEQLFALSFALEQLQRNINDLERCIQEWAISPGHAANKPTP